MLALGWYVDAALMRQITTVSSSRSVTPYLMRKSSATEFCNRKVLRLQGVLKEGARNIAGKAATISACVDVFHLANAAHRAGRAVSF